MSTTNSPIPATEITFYGDYTCTHHNDQQRIACPVCLVTALTAERDQLRAEVEQKRNLLVIALRSAGDQETRASRAEAALLFAAGDLRAPASAADLCQLTLRVFDAAAYLKRAESFSKLADEAEDELLAVKAELASNCKKVSVLREALVSLMAEQGSNAERPICRDWWQAAMDKCRAALTATEDAMAFCRKLTERERAALFYPHGYTNEKVTDSSFARTLETEKTKQDAK